MSLLPGARIGGYRIARFLSSGGFGAVYAVHDVRRDRPAALKLLHAELQTHGDPFARFLREAHVLETLHHPNVVELLDSGSLPDGRAYLVTELLDGMDLEEHLERHGALSVGEAIELLAPICDALDAAHRCNIIHRDIKASNVFLDRRGDQLRVVLLDFGLAKVIAEGTSPLSSSRLALGTPGSMSPEQLRGGTIDARTDVYGLGALAYHLVTGRLPFADAPHASRAYMHLTGQRPRAAQAGRIAPAIDAVIHRAMATRPEDRFSDAAAFVAALRAASTERSAPAVVASTGAELGIYVEVHTIRPAASPEAALDAIDAAMHRAEQMMQLRGFSTAFERSTGMLFVASADDAGHVMREALCAAAEVRATSTLDLEVAVAVHQGENIRRIEEWIPAHRVDAVAVPAPRPDSQSGSHTQMMALIGRRTVGLVHDMRSPLSVIISNVEMVMEDVDDGKPMTDEHRGMLADIKAAALILKATIAEVLDASATERHRSTRIPVCVPDMIERAVKLTDSQIRARVLVSHHNASVVLGSQGQLVQVVTNLIVNAADAMGSEGQITIQTGQGENDQVEITVQDNGPGIPVEIIENIFDPFFTTKAPDRGTGLGLALVREIVEQHGGKIGVASSTGVGTRFTIRLPSAPAAACMAM
jgi:serine/threonine-protein kinase